jgi:hypothetical protein
MADKQQLMRRIRRALERSIDRFREECVRFRTVGGAARFAQAEGTNMPSPVSKNLEEAFEPER